jgi:ABC-type Mn2+/Zn2+ transport system permease subunit/Mn-dependent DtxR family transcriptional regulator
MDQSILEIIFTEQWAIRALIASCLVGITCGALGCFVVLRNMSMFGDGLSHSILPGVAIAFLIVGYTTFGFFTGAVIASFVAAIIITWIQNNIQTKNDAAIGIVYTAMFSIGIMIISYLSRTGGVHLDLEDFLFGQVLGVSDEDLYLTGLIAVYVIISLIAFYRYLFITTFQPVIAETIGISVNVVRYFMILLLSFTIVASLQSVGFILVVAMLITPSSTALLLSDRLKHVILISSLIGLLSAIIGLFLSIYFETTSGPAMVVVSSVFYFLVAFFAPKKGMLSRMLRRYKQRKKINIEDVLKQSLKLHEKGALSLKGLADRVTFGEQKLKKYLNLLVSDSSLKLASNGSILLTEKGIEQATRLVRAHRLWETYLVTEMGLTEEQIHDDAEKYEHLLTDELLDEVDASLGYPMMDPHGSPIPLKKGVSTTNALGMLNLNTTVKIANRQPDQIKNKLWELGLSPSDEITVISKSSDNIHVNADGKKINIRKAIADQINIDQLSDSLPS